MKSKKEKKPEHSVQAFQLLKKCFKNNQTKLKKIVQVD